MGEVSSYPNKKLIYSITINALSRPGIATKLFDVFYYSQLIKKQPFLLNTFFCISLVHFVLQILEEKCSFKVICCMIRWRDVSHKSGFIPGGEGLEGGGGGHALNTCTKFNLPLSVNIILVLLPD